MKMYGQSGSSGFPTMAGFLGEKPTKRPRMEGPPKDLVSADMSKLPPEMDDEEVWEELDEDAMDECMTLATQMCTEPFEDVKNKIVSGNNRNASSSFSSNVKNSSHSKNDNISHFGDSGFSSTKGTGHDTSRVFYNSVKSKGSFQQLDTSARGSLYTNRFSDFTSLSTSKKPLSASRPVQSSGKVYNSVPVKGSVAAGHASLGTPAVYPSTSKDSSREELQNTLKKTDCDRVKLEEDILLKQGEISMLRSELKRKEAALEAERLDRCSAIEAAEKRGREKAATVSSEAEAKVKERNKTIEKLQDELHFKNREVQELDAQCRRLEMQQTQQQRGLSPSQRRCGDLPSKKVSPMKPISGFRDRFDFADTTVSRKNVEVQTETCQVESKRRPKMDVTFSRGRGRGSRQVACLFSKKMKLEMTTDSVTRGSRWALDDSWTDVLSRVIADYEDCDDVQKQLLNLSIQRLEELHIMLVSQRPDVSKLSFSKASNVAAEYEGLIAPPLSVLKCLTTTTCGEEIEKAILAVCTHMQLIVDKDVIVNGGIWPLVLPAVEQLSRITPSLSKKMCQLLQERLRDCCSNDITSDNLISLLQVLQALAHHTDFTNNICCNEGSCFIAQLCLSITSQSKNHLQISTALQEWLLLVVANAPTWFCSDCSCPSKLLAALLKQVYSTLGSVGTGGALKADLNHLLISTIRLLHRWSTKDSSWWEKVAYLPHYTAVMGTIINNARDVRLDRQTVDLLCDLYEFDEKIFEIC